MACHILFSDKENLLYLRNVINKITVEDLEDFLRANRNEVIAMSIFEYNKDEEEKKLRKAEFEFGREEGRKEGKQEILKSMVDTGKYSLEEIAEVFHISIEEVKRIKKL